MMQVQTQSEAAIGEDHVHPLSQLLALSDPPDSDDGNGQSGEDNDNDLDDHLDGVRLGKRKRPISVSCELCKQRKVKCDRGQPSCGWCSRNGAICEYKERKKPGLRAGYGRELEQRLDKLEDVLRAHSEILMNANILTANSASPMSGASGSGSAMGSSHPILPSIQANNTSVLGDLGSARAREPGPPLFPRNLAEPFRSATQAETALFLQRPSTFTPATSRGLEYGVSQPTPPMQEGFQPMTAIPAQNHLPPSGVAGQDYYATPSSGSQSAIQTTSLGLSQSQRQISSDQDLPPYDLLYALVDLYFKHINTWCPILHRKATLDSLFGPSLVEETDKVLLHAIVATTLRYSSDARLTEERRKHYHDVSKQRVLLYGLEHSSVKSLQALVILALDLTGSSNGPPGWNIMALITRSVVQLGLAVESNSFAVAPSFTSIYTLRAMILPEPRDFIEEESRRRLFWMVYLLDRYATIATAFEFALDDREIDRALPCRDDLWLKNQKVETRWFRPESDRREDPGGSPEREVNKPENLGAFSYYIEILGILSKIHKFLKRPVDISRLSDVEQWQMRYRELDNSLTSWKFGLPGDYGNMAKVFQPSCAKALNCGWVMLHATYHTAVIRLHSSAAYPTTRSPIFTASYSASQRCHGAVENIAALGEFVIDQGLLPRLGPPFAFTLWVAARLLLVHGSTVEHKLSPQIAWFVDALREMGRFWPVAGRYCELLTRVLDEHTASESTGDGVTPSSVRILADMRRTAFDLDFLIGRQPRHVSGGVAHNGAVGEGAGGATGGSGNGAALYSRYPSVTPARTPAPNELEYLDVFDFFNVPRVPFGPAEMAVNGGGVGGGGGVEGPERDSVSRETGEAEAHHREDGDEGKGGAGGERAPTGAASTRPEVGAGPSAGAAAVIGEFNITDYMVDANRDWLFKQEGGKFMS